MPFPYTGKTNFSNTSADPNVVALMSAHAAVEDIVAGLVNVDPNIKILAHLDNSVNTQQGSAGIGSGAIRFWAGKYSNGVLIEGSGSNLVPNPSAEIDLSSWSAIDGSVSLNRDSSQFYSANGTASQASFKIAGTSNAGQSYVKTSIPITSGQSYSASVYIFAPNSGSKAKLEMSFSGGSPSTSNTGDVSLTPGTWNRLRLENVGAGTNTTCEIRVYLTQQAPGFVASSRLSTIAPAATAQVSDNAMTINAGDLVMCALTANPAGPAQYAWHMVTAAATGVSSSALRLDDATAAPTFPANTQLSRLAPAGGDSVLVTDNALVLNAGDYVFCNLVNGGYAWHLVTTGATGAASGSLRLDDAPSPPAYVAGSRLTRLAPTSTAAVTDNAMTISNGDMVMCRTISNPGSSGYAWHMVTSGGTGVNSPNLRLDNAGAAPVFASGSIFSKKSPAATGSDSNGSAVLNTGDIALANTTRNPASGGYAFHLITNGATGVNNSALRIDQTSSDAIFADCIQLEASPVSTSFIDASQGAGYSGAVGSTTSRAASKLSFPTTGLGGTAMSVAFWMYPLWSGADGREHVLFDMAFNDEQDRIRLTKDVSNNLVLSVYDTSGGLKEVVTNSAVAFSRETWQHIAFTNAGGSLQIYLNGTSQAVTPSGSGTGLLTNIAGSLYLGSDYRGNLSQGAVFDDFVVSASVMTGDAISKIASDSAQFLGVAAARKGLDIGQGTAVSNGSAGVQSSVLHGLGTTPSFIEISERGNGLVYLSAPADSNSFYVTASANAVTFDWRAFA